MLCHSSLFIFSLCRYVTFYKTLTSLSTVYIKAHIGLLQLLKWPCHTSFFTYVAPLVFQIISDSKTVDHKVKSCDVWDMVTLIAYMGNSFGEVIQNYLVHLSHMIYLYISCVIYLYNSSIGPIWQCTYCCCQAESQGPVASCLLVFYYFEKKNIKNKQTNKYNINK